MPTTTAPDLSRERLFSLQLSTEPVLAAACTEGRWAPCPGAAALVGTIPTAPFPQHSPRAAPQSHPRVSPSPEQLRGCHQPFWAAPSSDKPHRTPLESRVPTQALACFCLSRYSDPQLWTILPHVNVQHIPAGSSCCLWHFAVAEFWFVLNFQPSEAFFSFCIFFFFCCIFSVLLRTPPTIYSLSPVELLDLSPPPPPGADPFSIISLLYGEPREKNKLLAALC